ncbi:MAG: hypothetical protein KC496_18290, partial [Anaerolineae bacterium]|nr:hypothetical protein [Anaerolineae bacterium]
MQIDERQHPEWFGDPRPEDESNPGRGWVVYDHSSRAQAGRASRPRPGAKRRRCKQCGAWLPTGVHGLQKYCDDACKQQAYRKRRKGAQ